MFKKTKEILSGVKKPKAAEPLKLPNFKDKQKITPDPSPAAVEKQANKKLEKFPRLKKKLGI